MGLRGPQPKSAELRQLEGERAHRPLPAARPANAFGFPDRPKGMPAAARRVWDQLQAHFEQIGTVQPIHATALQQYCEDFAELQAIQSGMRKQAKKSGLTLVEFLGTEEGKALSREKARISTRLRPREVQFGMTPLASSRIEPAFIPSMPVASMTGGDPQGIEAALCG